MTPKKIQLHTQSRELELVYDDGHFRLPAEFLRVHSPSAEVQGHGPGQKQLPLDKQDVAITGIEAQGHYAIKLIFDDGHDSGIYTWPLLRQFAEQQATLWQRYLEEAEEARTRQAGASPVKWV